MPEAFIPETGARIMSLKNGLAKMSKSAEDEGSRICISDSPDVIRSKVKACKTDSSIGLEFDNPDRPECRNLLSIYQLTSGKSKEVKHRVSVPDYLEQFFKRARFFVRN